ncbi:hypothetical protein RUND412_009331 [Rhizina undulata]
MLDASAAAGNSQDFSLVGNFHEEDTYRVLDTTSTDSKLLSGTALLDDLQMSNLEEIIEVRTQILWAIVRLLYDFAVCLVILWHVRWFVGFLADLEENIEAVGVQERR